jgi:hypothetical protein
LELLQAVGGKEVSGHQKIKKLKADCLFLVIPKLDLPMVVVNENTGAIMTCIYVQRTLSSHLFF